MKSEHYLLPIRLEYSSVRTIERDTAGRMLEDVKIWGNYSRLR